MKGPNLLLDQRRDTEVRKFKHEDMEAQDRTQVTSNIGTRPLLILKALAFKCKLIDQESWKQCGYNRASTGFQDNIFKFQLHF